MKINKIIKLATKYIETDLEQLEDQLVVLEFVDFLIEENRKKLEKRTLKFERNLTS